MEQNRGEEEERSLLWGGSLSWNFFVCSHTLCVSPYIFTCDFAQFNDDSGVDGRVVLLANDVIYAVNLELIIIKWQVLRRTSSWCWYV